MLPATNPDSCVKRRIASSDEGCCYSAMIPAATLSLLKLKETEARQFPGPDARDAGAPSVVRGCGSADNRPERASHLVYSRTEILLRAPSVTSIYCYGVRTSRMPGSFY